MSPTLLAILRRAQRDINHTAAIHHFMCGGTPARWLSPMEFVRAMGSGWALNRGVV